MELEKLKLLMELKLLRLEMLRILIASKKAATLAPTINKEKK